MAKDYNGDEIKDTLEASYVAADGEKIDLYRAGRNDYWAYFHESDYSVRGDLKDVMEEILEAVNAPEQTAASKT